MFQIAVLGSGRGSNFAAILEAIESGRIPHTRVCLVVSNNSSAGILSLAREHGIATFHWRRAGYATDAGYAEALLRTLNDCGADVIALAGFMKMMPREIIAAYPQRIVNIHPALLPKFGGKGMYGIHVHEAVIAAGERESGATVHLVDEEYDHGEIILQRRVPLATGETPESLAAKVLSVEHEIYPEALRSIAAKWNSHE